jgi:hypothetical protein
MRKRSGEELDVRNTDPYPIMVSTMLTTDTK